MLELAPGVRRLKGFPPATINAYMVGDVLVDARTKGARRGILRQLRDVPLSAHVLTHAHPDHFGASHAVCEAFGIPLWAGEADVEAIETGRPQLPPGRRSSLMQRGPSPAGHPVARGLREGDDVAGFVVLETPGHTPGHLALWRASDRVLIGGDVFFNLPRLGPPPGMLTLDPERNRESMRRLAGLRPAIALFGHGPPVRDPERLLRAVPGA
jgi:glyoxylase-like metal-dependent hydrolase (beta-lactamase superfamily II)